MPGLSTHFEIWSEIQTQLEDFKLWNLPVQIMDSLINAVVSTVTGWRFQDEPNLLWSVPIHKTREVCYRHV